jgi:hypothetical protein
MKLKINGSNPKGRSRTPREHISLKKLLLKRELPPIQNLRKLPPPLLLALVSLGYQPRTNMKSFRKKMKKQPRCASCSA